MKTHPTTEDLLDEGYEKRELNGGAITEYRKAFNRGCYVAVRFNEHKDGIPRSYLIFPHTIYALRSDLIVDELESLRRYLES